MRLLKDNASIYICADWKTSICIQLHRKIFILRNTSLVGKKKAENQRPLEKLSGKTSGLQGRTIPLALATLRFRDPSLRLILQRKREPKDWQEKEKQRFHDSSIKYLWTEHFIPFWSMRKTRRIRPKNRESWLPNSFWRPAMRRCGVWSFSENRNNFTVTAKTGTTLYRNRTGRMCRSYGRKKDWK